MNQQQQIFLPGTWPLIPFVPTGNIDLSDPVIITYDPPSPPGPAGEPGPPGPPSPDTKECINCSDYILITDDYDAKPTDYYIGCQLTNNTNLILPLDAPEGKILIIKLEMGPPVGNRKLTVKGNGFTIDGNANITLQNPWECLTIIFRDCSWYIISQFN